MDYSEYYDYYKDWYIPTNIDNLKPGDTIYRIKTKLDDYIEETFRVLEVNMTRIPHVVICNIFEGPVEQVNLNWVERGYRTYEYIVEHNINLARDGIPWDRPYDLIVTADKIENAEYYV